ncbi:MAG: sugar transferase, partial [Pygmaiobacter sp.]
GLTGWAQINGRDELPIPQKAELDGYYVQHRSFALDVKIFFKTIANVLGKKGIVEGKKTD